MQLMKIWVGAAVLVGMHPTVKGKLCVVGSLNPI